MKTIVRAEWSKLIFLLAVLLGIFVRFNPNLLADFPLNQGGMFAVMVEDLKANHYRLPAFTFYNHSNIPFAYPPFGFYVGGLISDLFGLTAVEVLRWVPSIFASLSILAFYSLAAQLFESNYHTAVATLFFALMPRAFSWFVSGAGLTRAPGQLFLLLSLACVVRLYKENRRTDIFWAGLFAGLTIMSHPEAAVHMIASVILLWAMLGRSRSSFAHLVGAGAVTLIVSMPWWATVIRFHGIAPFLSAVQTGQKGLAVLNLISFDFTEEVFATLIAILGLIGLARCLIEKKYLLPIWLASPFIVEGRSAVLPAAIPLAMLAAIGLIDILLPVLAHTATPGREGSEKVSFLESGILIYVLFYLFLSAYQFGAQLSTSSLSPSDRDAMDWVYAHTPKDSRFLVLTGTNSISCDIVMEWFPALADRRSIHTVQGTEWTQGANFAPYVRSTYAAQACLTEGDVKCLDEALSRSAYDYLYVSKIPRLDCKTIPYKNAFHYFLESLASANEFRKVYESDGVIIFDK
ncbi:MAG TPA: glycosyltransferase family 39 protein [Anaerolineales bacterium]|jgi:hypothetical protein|nr:glycosyltransferase family 39 protein [Anaerolineales bacterium]